MMTKVVTGGLSVNRTNTAVLDELFAESYLREP